MNLVDSSGWIKFFIGGTNARSFESPIVATEELAVPTIVLLEVYKHVLLLTSEGKTTLGANARRRDGGGRQLVQLATQSSNARWDRSGGSMTLGGAHGHPNYGHAYL
jgi:hypothetical protein